MFLRKRVVLMLFASGLFWVSGCVYSDSEFTESSSDNKVSVPNASVLADSGDVFISESLMPDRPYVEIGKIEAFARSFNAVSSNPTRADVNEELRAKAFEVGADAVIGVHYKTERTGLLSRGLMTGTGTAIIYSDYK